MGYPGRVRRPGRASAASVAGFETLAFGDLSLLVKCGVQFGLFGGAILHLGTRAPPRALPRATSRALDLPGCFAMTETGHGSNVQALAHDRDLRRRDARSSSSTRRTTTRARTTSATPRATAGWRSSSRSSIVRRRGARRARAARPDPRRGRRRAPDGVRIEDCGAEARPQRRRQRAHLVRPRARPAREPARPLRAGRRRTAPTRARSRTRPSASSRCSGRSSRAASASAARRSARPRSRSTIADPPRRWTRRQFGPPGRARGAAAGLPHAPAPAAARARDDLRAALRAGAAASHELHEVFTARRRTTTAAGASSRRSPPALKAVATWHATDTIQTCREACGGAGYLRGQPLRRAEGRHRRLHDVRGRQHGPAAARGQEPADRLPRPVRRARPARHGAVRRRPGDRDRSPSAPRSAACSPGSPTGSPGATTTRDLLDRETQLDLFRWRHEHILAGAARRLKGGIDAGARPVRRARRLPGPRRRDARARGSTWRCSRRSPTPSPRARTPPCAPCSTASAASTRCTGSRPSAAGSRSTAASPGSARRRSSRPSTRCAPRCATGRRAARRRVRRPGERARRRRAVAERVAGVRTRLPRAERERQMLDDRARAVRRARLRRRDDGRGRGRRRRHEAAALHVLRQQGAALPRVHAPGGATR